MEAFRDILAGELARGRRRAISALLLTKCLSLFTHFYDGGHPINWHSVIYPALEKPDCVQVTVSVHTNGAGPKR